MPHRESPSGPDLPGLKIVSVTPGAALAGTQILLVGTGFGASSNAPLSIRFDGVSVPRGQIFRLSDDQIYVAIPPTATRSLLEVRVGERAALAPEPIDRLDHPRVLPQDLVLGGDATADVRLTGTDHGGRIRELQPYLWTLATPEDVASGESSLHDHSRGDPHQLQGLTIDDAGRVTSSRPRPGLYWIVAHVGSTHATTSLTVPPEGGAP